MSVRSTGGMGEDVGWSRKDFERARHAAIATECGLSAQRDHLQLLLDEAAEREAMLQLRVRDTNHRVSAPSRFTQFKDAQVALCDICLCSCVVA
eukprot:2292516-Rhodomonas_salina.1